MRWLINYIRSCFCKHEWEQLRKDLAVYGSSLEMPIYYETVYRCKKCGMIQKIKI